MLLLIAVIALRTVAGNGLKSHAGCCTIAAFEAEHQSLISPYNSTELAVLHHWTPPVLNAGGHHLFSWRVATQAGMVVRNVTQVSGMLTLIAGGRSFECRIGAEHSVLCGNTSDLRHASRCEVTLTLTLSSITATGETVTTRCTAQGEFVLGLLHHEWGGATWIGLTDPDDTAAQFRTVANIRDSGFVQEADIASATLFVAGLGGYRATVNGRALDPNP